MIIKWTVVVDDGTRPYGPGIQIDQRRPLRVTTGEDLKIEITLINPVGGVVLLDDGFLQLTARSGSRPSRQILTARSQPSANNQHAIVIAADSTAREPPVRGLFDVWMVKPGSPATRTDAIPASEFVLLPGALGKNYL